MTTDDLGLETLVRQIVVPVLEPYGFELVEGGVEVARLESDAVMLRFTAYPRDGDVGLYFGRVGTDERFSFSLYLGLVAPEHRAAFERMKGLHWWDVPRPGRGSQVPT